MNLNNNYKKSHTRILKKAIQNILSLSVVSQIVLLSLIIIIILFVIGGLKRISTYNIVLDGKETINIYEGGSFVEPGYTAYNYKGDNSTNKVKVKSNIDFDKIGEYKVEYSIKNIWKRNVVSRTINVLKNPIDDIDFSLIGESDIVVNFGKKYVEPGYKLESNDGVDYSGYVSIKSNVNDSKVGEYEVEYIFKINKRSKKRK